MLIYPDIFSALEKLVTSRLNRGALTKNFWGLSVVADTGGGLCPCGGSYLLGYSGDVTCVSITGLLARCCVKRGTVCDESLTPVVFPRVRITPLPMHTARAAALRPQITPHILTHVNTSRVNTYYYLHVLAVR